MIKQTTKPDTALFFLIILSFSYLGCSSVTERCSLGDAQECYQLFVDNYSYNKPLAASYLKKSCDHGYVKACKMIIEGQENYISSNVKNENSFTANNTNGQSKGSTSAKNENWFFYNPKTDGCESLGTSIDELFKDQRFSQNCTIKEMSDDNEVVLIECKGTSIAFGRYYQNCMIIKKLIQEEIKKKGNQLNKDNSYI